MPDAKKLPSRRELNRMFFMLPDGALYWRWRDEMPLAWNSRYAGALAGRGAKGKYNQVGIAGQRFPVHRVIYKIATGREPRLVDHHDRDKWNNNPGNLRPGNKSRNGANSHRRKRPFPRGVTLCKSSTLNPFRARIRNQHLGLFPTVAKAAAAFRVAARASYGAFARA